jgi:hypothetical protein
MVSRPRIVRTGSPFCGRLTIAVALRARYTAILFNYRCVVCYVKRSGLLRVLFVSESRILIVSGLGDPSSLRQNELVLVDYVAAARPWVKTVP